MRPPPDSKMRRPSSGKPGPKIAKQRKQNRTYSLSAETQAAALTRVPIFLSVGIIAFLGGSR